MMRTHRRGVLGPRAMGRKGMFAIIGAFAVILAIVVALVWFFGLYKAVFNVSGVQEKQDSAYTNAQSFHHRLLYCQSKTFLTETKLRNNACGTGSGVSGYTVDQKATFGCTQKTWSIGIVNDPDSSVFTYPVIVEQDGGTTCHAILKIFQ